MLVGTVTVGKVMIDAEFIFAEERKNLFPIFLTGTTIQDSSSRARKDENNYLLSLISEIVENISTKKVFTKLDLC